MLMTGASSEAEKLIHVNELVQMIEWANWLVLVGSLLDYWPWIAYVLPPLALLPHLKKRV